MSTPDERIAELETEVAEMEQLLDLQHSRMGEAIKWWQELTGNHETWPDLGRLLEAMLMTLRLHDTAGAGLMAEIERLKAKAKELDQRIMDAYKNGVLDSRHAHAAIAEQEKKP